MEHLDVAARLDVARAIIEQLKPNLLVASRLVPDRFSHPLDEASLAVVSAIMELDRAAELLKDPAAVLALDSLEERLCLRD